MDKVAALLLALLNMFKKAKKEAVNNEIKDDPLGAFGNKFGSVRNDSKPLPESRVKPDS